MIRLNGQKIAATLDTGSPISILPKSYTKTVRPKRINRNESTRMFVDMKRKPIPILNRYTLKAEMNGIEWTTIWWEVETSTQPIIGVDNFGLQVTQRTTKPGYNKRCVTKNQDNKLKARKPILKPIHRVENISDTSNQETSYLEQTLNKLRDQLKPNKRSTLSMQPLGQKLQIRCAVQEQNIDHATEREEDPYPFAESA